MNYRVTTVIFFLLCGVHVISFAQSPVASDTLHAPVKSIFSASLHLDPSPLAQYTYSPPLDYWRLAGVTGAAISTLGASYLYLKNSWWSERPSKFHFDTGRDLRYSLNMDKLAHFYGGAIGTDLFYGALRWANMTEQGAYVYGAVLSTVVQLAMEMKDGYAPRWGFSFYDVGSGTLGALYPVGKRYIPFLRNVDMKWSYYRPSGHYFQINSNGTWNDDYEGQTYWFALKVNNILPQSLERFWPDILGIAIGFSLDTNNTGDGGGDVEVFIGLDYDLTSLIPSNSAFWEGLKQYMNYIHLPAPAIRITPSVIWFGLYF